MSGARVVFDARLDDAAARQRLADLIERLEDKTGFLNDVGDELLHSTRDRFVSQQDPDGKPWKPLSRATIRERERAGKTPIQILTRNSYMRSSLNKRVDGDTLSIGTPVPYGAIHQLGGTISRPAREGVVYRHVSWKSQKMDNRFAPKKGGKGQPKANFVQKVERKAYEISMPARPFLGLSKADQAAIINIASDWLGE